MSEYTVFDGGEETEEVFETLKEVKEYLDGLEHLEFVCVKETDDGGRVWVVPFTREIVFRERFEEEEEEE